MRFVSTRGDPSESFSLEDAIFSGYARDGGMYLPETIPEITPQQLQEWSVNYLNDTVGYSLFHQIAVDVLSLYIDEDDIPRNDLLEILQEGIDFPIRVTHFSPDSTTIRSDSAEFHPEKISWTQDSLHILELCNGPTFTFKDIGMQFLGRLMGYLLKKNNREKITIIVATSGDTGSAAIHAVENHPLIDLYVLYPGNNRISNLQERQMATNTANNIFCIRFDGSSDDADVVVTKLFKNENLKKYNLTTLNSVNIGRVLMQTVHFIFAYVQSLAPEIIRCVKNNEPLPPVRYCIPTGGLGNGSSCYLVKKMGIPIEKIIMAVNENDTISRTLESGTFKLNAVRVTNAPAMDICNPYNIERLLYLMSERDSNFVRNFIAKHDTDGGATLSEKVHQEFSRDFSSYSIPQTDVCKTIFSIFQKWGEIIDPHTAVGVTGSSRFNETNENSNSAVPLICVATAHPAKFPETIEGITKTPFVLPQALQNILEKPLRVTDLILDSMADSIGKMICDKYYRE